MGTQIAADGLRHPTGTGPTNVEAQRARTGPVKVSEVPADGEVPVWDETIGGWVPSTPEGGGAALEEGTAAGQLACWDADAEAWVPIDNVLYRESDDGSKVVTLVDGETTTALSFAASDQVIGGAVLAWGDDLAAIDAASIPEVYIDGSKIELYAPKTGGGLNSISVRGDEIRHRLGATVVQTITPTKVTINGELDHDGNKVGFFGTAPIAKPTGVAVDAAGIHAALVALGLISA